MVCGVENGGAGANAFGDYPGQDVTHCGRTRARIEPLKLLLLCQFFKCVMSPRCIAVTVLLDSTRACAIQRNACFGSNLESFQLLAERLHSGLHLYLLRRPCETLSCAIC
jgi:hypothetical protein